MCLLPWQRSFRIIPLEGNRLPLAISSFPAAPILSRRIDRRFIITGPSGTTKKVLIRGIGPSLSKFGIPGVLADPLLELHDGAGGLIVANDNWQSGDTSQVPIDFQPTDAK